MTAFQGIHLSHHPLSILDFHQTNLLKEGVIQVQGVGGVAGNQMLREFGEFRGDLTPGN